MNLVSKNPEFFFRKLKVSDFKKFKKLFYACFKKKISYDFFKWRYFSDKSSFCYGLFVSNDLIANVGMKSLTLNNKNKEKIFSRHSSMVLKKYRGKGIFSKLLKEVKKNIKKKVNIIIMWPNKKNFSKFDLANNAIIKKKFYLYKTNNSKKKLKQTTSLKIDNINKFKYLIKGKDDFILKNYEYFKQRYLSYRRNDYLINKFELNSNISFFILKKNNEKHVINYVVIDHFGSKLIKSQHLKKIINEERNIIFLSKSKINKKNHYFIDHLNLHIGFLNKTDFQKKKIIFKNKKFMLGDTDSFITIK